MGLQASQVGLGVGSHKLTLVLSIYLYQIRKHSTFCLRWKLPKGRISLSGNPSFGNQIMYNEFLGKLAAKIAKRTHTIFSAVIIYFLIFSFTRSRPIDDPFFQEVCYTPV